MREWKDLGRRQQLWVLDRQDERLAASLGGRSRASLATAVGVGPAALSPSILLSTPYPPVLLAKVAFELGVEASLLHPVDEAPSEADATFRSDPSLCYVMGASRPDDADEYKVPIQDLAKRLKSVVASGVSRVDLARAAGMGYSAYSRLERPRTTTIASWDMTRMEQILSQIPNEAAPFEVTGLSASAARFRIAARMRRPVAGALLAALGVDARLVAVSGPSPDAVALRLDVVVGVERVAAALNVLNPAPKPKRRGLLSFLFGRR